MVYIHRLVYGILLPARYPQHRPGLISYVCSAEHLEGPISVYLYKNPYLPGSCPVISTICSRNLDCFCHWHQSSWNLPHEVSETSAADQLATVFMTRSQRLPACSRSRKSFAAVVAPSSVTTRCPGAQGLHCHVDLFLGRPPNDQWKRRPGRPRQRWIDQVWKDDEFPRRTCGGVWRVVVTEEQRWLAGVFPIRRN